nr:Stk1 family PASTA domain-containing Ser/Thr kinase [Actinomycetota bacterium]
MAVSDTLINTLFDGRYRVLRRLGSGGMANVYLAEDQQLGRRVAIKILNERHAHDEQFVERFRREAKNAAGLSHPNIVPVYDRGEAEGTSYIAMEYLEGRTLKQLIVRDTMPIAVVVEYTRQILAALGFAHRRGIVHRDIKPHNVLVSSDGRLKVTDFGIARAGASQMTEVGSIIGTAQYLSPEQARGTQVDQRSDLYSTGVVLYELLTGVVPFSGDTPVEIAMKHLSTAPEPPSRKRPGIPRELDMVVLRALAKDVSERYGSAEEMDSDLARIQRGLNVSQETEEAATAVLARGADATVVSKAAVVAPPPFPGSTYYDYEPLPRRRRPLWPWLLALLLLVGAGLGGWYAYTQIQDELTDAKPVALPLLEGIPEALAVQRVLDLGLNPKVVRQPHEEVQEAIVFRQEPAEGERIERGNTVTLYVSTGKPKARVPDVVGQTVEEATDALEERGLRVNAVEIFSSEPEGTVTAQSPGAGRLVVRGATVRINVSRGPRPIGVPSVVGQSFESASSELTQAGFAVARTDVESNEPAGRVVDQSPDAGSAAAKGSTVSVSVSKGPSVTTVPDVTGLDAGSAQATLENAGFKVATEFTDTTDPGQDGVVFDQNPAGGSEAEPGSTVTIIVGRVGEEPAPPPPPPSATSPNPPPQ